MSTDLTGTCMISQAKVINNFKFTEADNGTVVMQENIPINTHWSVRDKGPWYVCYPQMV